MGSHHGNWEIVELEDDPKSSNNDSSNKNHKSTMIIDKGKKPQSIEDDINKLFEGINVRTSFHGLTFSDDKSKTPKRNPSKKPMRMSTSSSGIGNPDPVSLKQALRGLCISQASEMAAMKRLTKPSGSPAVSDSGKPPNMYRFGKASELKEVKVVLPEEGTSSSSRTTPQHLQETKIKSNNKSQQSTKKVGSPIRLNEILKETETGDGFEDKTTKVVNKPTVKLRRKGKLQNKPSFTPKRAVKTIIINKQVLKKESTLVCQKCHCAMNDAQNQPNSDHLDKSEFTQSSDSSIGEYSSSTSISETVSSMSRCSIGNRPHMSMDTRWQAIQNIKKKKGFLGLRHFNLLKKLGCGDIGTVYLAELVGTNCLFAIKVMDNELLETRKKMARAHTEREILRLLDHPFLPTLYAHFVSENLSCLVLEYCPGGDLHVLRQKQPERYYHEHAARFYVAEVLLALEYLHMLGIVYRDLKPENILVGQDGHIMLTDFDLSLRCAVNPTLLQSGQIDPPRISGPCAGSNCIDPFCINPHVKCHVSARESYLHTKPENQNRARHSLWPSQQKPGPTHSLGPTSILHPKSLKEMVTGVLLTGGLLGYFYTSFCTGKHHSKALGTMKR